MKHIVVDLEMNTIPRKSPARALCRMEVIEIGAVMLDDDLQEVAAFRTYVKPEYSDHIASNISALTRITDATVANAPRFQEAFRMFSSWCLGTGDEVTIYAWSDSDYTQIIKELALKKLELSEKEQKIIERKWTDFQREFDNHLGFEKQLSLQTALNMSGIDFEGKAHDALDDARNTADLLHVFKDQVLFDATLRKIEEAMKPKPLGNTLGSMFDFSLLA